VAKIIKGNHDGPKGGNNSYTIPGRGSHIPRRTLVKEVKEGQHPGFGTYERDGKEYVRAEPDSKTSNNVNED
jgi:hypothetical protein